LLFTFVYRGCTGTVLSGPCVDLAMRRDLFPSFGSPAEEMERVSGRKNLACLRNSSTWPHACITCHRNCVILRHDSAKKKNETSPALLHLVDAEKGQANCELKEVVRALSLLPIAYNIYRQLLSWTLSRRKHFFFLNEVACSDQSQTLVYAMCRYYTRLVASTQI